MGGVIRLDCSYILDSQLLGTEVLARDEVGFALGRSVARVGPYRFLIEQVVPYAIGAVG